MNAAPQTTAAPAREHVLQRIGIPQPLAWGFLGLLIFMIGDGVEAGYLSPFLVEKGVDKRAVALVFTIYGATASIAAWLSGAFSDLWGPRRVMWLGLGIWVAFEVCFLLFGVRPVNYSMILLCYGLRGFGYPLFAYGFLVWVTATTPPRHLGSAVGWFWFGFTGGLPTLGSLLASFVIPLIGPYQTLWLSLGLVILGGLIALYLVREPTGFRPLVSAGANPLSTLFSSISIAWQKPKTLIGCLVRIINTAPEFGFLVFLPMFFTETVGFTLEQWLRLLSYVFLSNIIWNLLFGIIGDRLGWRQTVAWCGGFGCAITTLLFYYVPHAVGANYPLCVLVGVLYGATLAGYVPLTALMPTLAPRHKGAAMSMLNLGAGAATWVGPGIVALFLKPLGVVGVMWIFAILYALSGVLALFLKLPEEVEHSDTVAN